MTGFVAAEQHTAASSSMQVIRAQRVCTLTPSQYRTLSASTGHMTRSVVRWWSHDQVGSRVEVT